MRKVAAERLLATNDSHWGWEYDTVNVVARVYVSDASERLRMEIVDEHTKSGLGAGTRRQTFDYDLGTLSRPKLGQVKSILKKHGAERSRAGYPFSPKWDIPDGGKDSLGNIIAEASRAAGPDPESARRELIKRIERMSPAELEKAYRIIPASEEAGMDRVKVAKRMLALARELMAQNEEDEAVDEQFATKVRGLKTQMTKLAPKKRRRLKQYGIGMIRPTSTVEELVDALQRVVGEA